MTAAEILVLLGAVGAIAWVNWYFLLAGGSRERVAREEQGVQEVRIRVAGGYDPSRVRVRRGTRVRLMFDRQESGGCSEELLIPEFGIRRFLPAQLTTVIEVTPERSGTYEFTCGMGMLRGTLVVEDRVEN